ncbi:hypothetical protein M8818_007166 [Zalaria obscura]|uniref:Uncharacterized protein n=1 Tax=Zalaria obscura TaxID=2024903 RepID=A0ACC3S594_9PEZI
MPERHLLSSDPGFQISFPPAYPDKPPVITFSTDIFHPLVTPLTTFTYTTTDTGADTVSASDEGLPPGGFSLRHGFPQWFNRSKANSAPSASQLAGDTVPKQGLERPLPDGSNAPPEISLREATQPIHIVEVLFYLRSAFDSEAVLEAIPIEAAGNPGAWHAWQTYKAKSAGQTLYASQPSATAGDHQPDSELQSPIDAPRQQPGGAKRPGEWNWDGVWEERVQKGVQASVSDHVLFGGTGTGNDLISFVKMNPEILADVAAWKESTMDA